MTMQSRNDNELFAYALKLLAQTRETLATELTERKNDIDRGNTGGLSWKELERELTEASCS